MPAGIETALGPDMQVRPGEPRSAGFTLLEVIVVTAILMIAAMIGLPAFLNAMHRAKVETWVTQVAAEARAARLDAVKGSVRVYLQADLPGRRVVLFRENEVTPGFDAATDEQVREIALPQQGLAFWGPGDVGPAGPDAISGLSADGHLTFRPDGTTDRAGAIRFGDGQGNFLALSVGPIATGRVQILKWDQESAAWRPKSEWKWS